MVQAAVLDGLPFNAPAFGQDGFSVAEVDVGGGQIADALVVTVVPAQADDLQVGKIGLPHLVWRRGFDFERISRFYDDVSRAGDEVMGLARWRRWCVWSVSAWAILRDDHGCPLQWGSSGRSQRIH